MRMAFFSKCDMSEPFSDSKEEHKRGLTKPLLGDEVPVETNGPCRYEDEEEEDYEANPAVVDDDEFVLCGHQNDPVYRFNWCDSIMIWMVLPTLLW